MQFTAIRVIIWLTIDSQPAIKHCQKDKLKGLSEEKQINGYAFVAVKRRDKNMKAKAADWYKKNWSLDIKNMSWVENTPNEVDFIIDMCKLNGSERKSFFPFKTIFQSHKT